SGYEVNDVLVDGGSVGPVTAYSFANVTAAHTISASFKVTSYTVTVVINGGGSVTYNPVQAKYAPHFTLQLTATPVVGNDFVNWSTDVNTAYNPVSFQVDSNMTVTANFIRKPMDYTRSTFTATYSPISA